MHFEPKSTTLAPDAITAFHEVDSDRVASIVARMRAGEVNLPPVLVINDGFQYLVIDGHHRIAAAVEFGLDEVPVLLVTKSQAARMLKYCFDGEWPEQLSDYDRFITVNGKRYSEIRVID